MINFGKDVFEEGVEVGIEVGAERRTVSIIIENLKRNKSFKDIVEFLSLSEAEVKHYTELLAENGIEV